MNPQHVLALFIPILAIVTVGGTVALRTLLRHKERMAEMGGGRGMSEVETETRLARLEQSIEAMSIEIERNGEAHRYLTKLLAKQLGPDGQADLPK